MAQPPSLLSTLHGLATSLKQAQPLSGPVSSVFLSPYGPAQAADDGRVPLTRETVQEAVAGIKDVLEKFKTIWEEGGEDGRVRGAGKMKEWTQTTGPLLNLAPTLHHLSHSPASNDQPFASLLFPSSASTPFALPANSSPASLLEKTAKSLGLEVFRESVIEPALGEAAAQAVTNKETLILGATTLAVEIELTETTEEGWKVAKVRSVVTLESGEEPVPAVDELLGGPLRPLLAMMRDQGEQTGLEKEETNELKAARVLGELERRLREVVRVDRAANGSNLFKMADEIRLGVDGWVQAAGCEAASCSITSNNPYPTYWVSPRRKTSPRPVSHDQVVHIVPTPADAAPPRPLPAELLALTVDGGASSGWGTTSWEAVFEPALVVGVSGTSGSWGQTLLQQARSSTTPLPGGPILSVTWETPNSETPQVWTHPITPALEGVAISRVAVRSAEEVGRVIMWARAWAFVNEFWLGVFDAPPSLPSAPPIVPLDLDNLDAFLLAPPPDLPITLRVLPSSHPSILLTFPHPTKPLSSLSITITPTLVGPPTITLDPPSQTVSSAKLAALSARAGGWGQGVVRWVAQKLLETREQSVGVEGSDAAEREKRKREESGEVEVGAGDEEEDRKRVKM